MKSITKSQLNFLLEGITLLILMLIIATGLIMEFRLPPGSGGQGAALHGGRGRPLLTLAGLSRHEWGAIHFYLALTMILLLLVHVWLHWRWIWGMAQGGDPARRKVRGRAFLVITVLFLLLAGVPWLVPLRNGGVLSSEHPVQSTDGTGAGSTESVSPIYGAMTLNEVAQATGAKPDEVAKCLGVQGPVSGEERLGPLVRSLGISMAEARARIKGLEHRHEDQ